MRAVPVALILLAALAGPLSGTAAAGNGPETVVLTYSQAGAVLAWEPVPGAYFYTIYRGDHPDDLQPVARVRQNFYMDSDIGERRVIYYAITATGANGESKPSTISNAGGQCLATSSKLDFSVTLEDCLPDWARV